MYPVLNYEYFLLTDHDVAVRKVIYQSADHSADVRRLIGEALALVPREYIEIQRHDQVVLRFGRRSGRDLEVTNALGARTLAAPLGDVCGD